MEYLQWKLNGPSPDPFEMVCGDSTQYYVHYAESDATEECELRALIPEIVRKSLSLVPAHPDGIFTRLLFLWDKVYSSLEVVYTDELMRRNATHVTKCAFHELDEIMQGISDDDDVWREAIHKVSVKIRRMIEDALASTDLSALPPQIRIFYSDEDRNSHSQSEFPVQELAR